MLPIASSQTVTPLVDGVLYRVGCTVPLERLTWAPDAGGVYDALNCFVLLAPDEAVFIDAGPAIAEPAVRTALADVVGDRRLAVFPTRNEADCIGNLGLLLGEGRDAKLLFGGVGGILEWINDPAVPERETCNFLGRTRIEPAKNRMRYEEGGLSFRWFDAGVKEMWMTQWAYEASTRTLFSSDSFGFRHLEDAAQKPVVRTVDGLPDVDTVAREIVCRINWLPGASCDGVIERVVTIFDELDVEILAPVHGAVLVGRDVVRAHVDLAVDALRVATTLPV